MAPAVTQVRIRKRESRIRRDRYALPGRGQGWTVGRSRNRERRRRCDDPVEIKMALRHIGKAVEPGCQVAVLWRLHEPEVTFRQG